MPCNECEENGLDCCSECCQHEICENCDEHVDELAECGNNHCSDCCECWQCPGCLRWYSESQECSNCGYCERCCECSYCDNCRETVSETCVGCGYCNDCCCCGQDGDGLSYSGMLRFHTSETFKLNPLRRFISLEIEVADADGGANTLSVLENWRDSAVDDGSLEGNFCYEICVNPTNGDLFIDHVNDLGRALAKDGASANHSCGLHCHVDASDYNWFDLYKLCMLYCKIERALFDLVAPSRYSGSYSKPAKDHYNFASTPVKEFKQELLKRMYGRDFRDSYKDGMVHWQKNKKVFSERSEKYNSVRYYALNLHSFFYRGTVEFRHHHGTTNPDKMKHWGLICANLIEYANKKSVKDIKKLSETPHEALLSILPSHLVKWANERVKELRGDWTPKQKEIDGLPF